MSFNAGVLSPLLDGRSDLEKYYSGMRIGDNMIPLPYGPAERRPGTYYVAELKDSSKKAKLVSFQYSTEQAYILEYGNEYIRFYKDRGQIQTGAGTEDLSALNNIVAHWPLNDNLATQVVLDDDGNTHPGATVTADTADLHETGKVGTGCFDFNGADAVTVGDHADFSFDDTADKNFSLMAWVFWDGNVTSQFIISKQHATANLEWAFLVSAGKLIFRVFDQSEGVYSQRVADNAMSIGWHFVVATYDNAHASWTAATAMTYVALYVDGAAVDSTATNNASYAGMEALASDVAIGGRFDDVPAVVSFMWNDKIDNVAVFKDALTAAEVTALYSSSAYEISSSYLEADLFGLQHVQSADVLYNVHGDYPQSKLSRYAHDNWELADIVFDWPPFLEENDTATTIAIDNVAIGTGKILTASTAIFADAHVDSYWLIKHPRTDDEGANANAHSETISVSDTDGTVLVDVKGSWSLLTRGSYVGGFAIQRSYDSGTTWHTLQTFNPDAATVYYNPTGEEEVECQLKVTTRTRASGDLKYVLSVERFYHYGIVKITAVTDSTSATATVIRTIGSTDATKLWSEGAWSDERGYPVTSAFFEGRLFYAGTSHKPLNIWGSIVNDYDNMDTGDKLDDDAVKYTVDSAMQNMIRWLVAHETMLIGTSGGEWRLGSFDPADPITPANPMRPKRQTAYGSKEIQALLLANAVLFVDAQGRRVRGAHWIFEKGEVGGYDAPDYTMLAEHITESGIVGMAYQQNPYPILWCWLNDGKMIGMVFEPGQKVWGWFPLVIDGLVESVAVEPGTPEDTIWIIVKREINGVTKRYIEYFKPRDWGSDQKDCFFVDSGLTFDGGAAITITGISKADPCVVTAANAFSDGDQVKLKDVVGMTDVNDKVYTVSNPSTTNFELRDKLDTVDIDSAGFTIYASGGTAEKVDNTFSGLDHLEGETVSVLGDGAVHANVVVSSGVVTLTDYFNIVHIGLPYTSKLVPMKLAVPGANIRGKKKRIHQIIFSFNKTLGAKFGPTSGEDTIPFRKTTDPLGAAVPLFTGEKVQTFPGGYELDGDIYVEQTQPLPMTVRSITAKLKVYG